MSGRDHPYDDSAEPVPATIDLDTLSNGELQHLVTSFRSAGRHDLAEHFASVLTARRLGPAGEARRQVEHTRPSTLQTDPSMGFAARVTLGFIGVGLVLTLVLYPSMLAIKQGYTSRPKAPATSVDPRANLALTSPAAPARKTSPVSAPASVLPPAVDRSARAAPMDRPGHPAARRASRPQMEDAEGEGLLAASGSELPSASCRERATPSEQLLCEDAGRLQRSEASNKGLVTALGAGIPARAPSPIPGILRGAPK